jgi:hypothetical protein
MQQRATRLTGTSECRPPTQLSLAFSLSFLPRHALCSVLHLFFSLPSPPLHSPLTPSHSSLSPSFGSDVNFYQGRHFTVLLPLVVSGPVDSQLQVVLPEGAALPTPAAGPPVHHASASQETVRNILGSGHVEASGNSFPHASVQVVPTRPGQMVAFEGNFVFHRVTPLGASRAPWPSSWQPPEPPASGAVEADLQQRLADPAVPVRLVLSMTYATDTRAHIVSWVTRRLKDMIYFGPLSVWRD